MSRVLAVDRVANTRTNSVLRNGDFEFKPSVLTAQTSTAGRWIDGTAAGNTAQRSYGWAAPNTGSGVGANAAIGFDASISRSGSGSLKLSNLSASGAVVASSLRTIVPISSTAHELFALLPSTAYVLTGYIRTNNVATNSAFIDVREFGSTFTNLVTTSSNKLSGTDTSFRQVTASFTTNASTAWGALILRNNVAGNISDAWFDDITLIPV